MTLVPGERGIERDVGVMSPVGWVNEAEDSLFESVRLNARLFLVRSEWVGFETGADVIGDRAEAVIADRCNALDHGRGWTFGPLVEHGFLKGVRLKRIRVELGRGRRRGARVEDNARRALDLPCEEFERGGVGHAI